MTNTEQSAVSEKQLRKDNLAKYLYILPAFGTSASMAYFSSYLAMLFTDIFMIPVGLSAVLEMVRSGIAWVAGPIIGVFVDRTTLRIGKFWQWILIGAVGANFFNALTFILPSTTNAPESLAIVVFVLGILISVFQTFTATTIVAVYPRLSADPNTRSYLAIGQKLGRDGGKTLWGLIVPVMLVYFTTSGGSDAAGWASTAYIVGSFAILLNVVYAFILKGTSVEKDAQKEKEAARGRKKPKVPLSKVFRGLVSNRALLSMFLFLSIHKIYYFFHIMTASYFFKYVAQDFTKMGIFMTAFNLSAVVGAMFGVIWKKIFKDSKRSFVASGVVHIAILGVLTLSFSGLSTNMFIVFIGAASFFAGVIEAYMMPMFAAAADWSAWKTGERSDGLTMAVYSLTVRIGIFLSTAIRASLLASAGYDGAAYAEGAVPTEAVLNTIVNLQTLYPFIFAIICFSIVALFYPLTDKKVAKINEEIEAGRIGESRDETAVESA